MHATYITHTTQVTQGFMHGTQHTQDVSNDMAGIYHTIWLASN